MNWLAFGLVIEVGLLLFSFCTGCWNAAGYSIKNTGRYFTPAVLLGAVLAGLSL